MRLTNTQIIEKLESLPEHTMARDIFVPLLKKTKARDVRFVGGPREQGIDIIYHDLTSLDRAKVYQGIQFKKGALRSGSRGSNSTVKEVRNQAEEAFEKDHYDHEHNSTHRISRFICAVTGDINDQARTDIARAKSRVGASIDFWTGEQLCGLVRKYWRKEFIAYFRIGLPALTTPDTWLASSKELTTASPFSVPTDEPAFRRVAELVASAGHRWIPVAGGPFGISGYIEVVRKGAKSAELIGVAVRTGRNHLINQKKRADLLSRRVHLRHRVITMGNADLSYYRGCPYPVIVVWFDPVSQRAFWGTVDENSEEKFAVLSVLDRSASSRIARIVERRDLTLSQYPNPQLAPFKFTTIKREAFTYYNRLRATECLSPMLGTVEFTLRGWRHITSRRRTRSRMLRSLELLSAAWLILTTERRARICRVTPKGHLLIKQTAIITDPYRANAVVSVITEKIRDRQLQFLSVYEEGGGRRGR